MHDPRCQWTLWRVPQSNECHAVPWSLQQFSAFLVKRATNASSSTLQRGRLVRPPFSESRKCKDYQLNLTIACKMRWPIVFVADPKFGLARAPLLLNVRFKFWSLLRNVRFGWLRKL